MILYNKILRSSYIAIVEPTDRQTPFLCKSCILKHWHDQPERRPILGSSIKTLITTHPVKGSFKVTQVPKRVKHECPRFSYQNTTGVAYPTLQRVIGNHKIVYITPTLIKE